MHDPSRARLTELLQHPRIGGSAHDLQLDPPLGSLAQLGGPLGDLVAREVGKPGIAVGENTLRMIIPAMTSTG